MSKVDFHISIEKDLLKQFRIKCVEAELGVGEVVAQLISEFLEVEGRPWNKPEPPKVRKVVDAPIVMEGVVVPGPMPKIEMATPAPEWSLRNKR